jgi:DNA repair exonuclease SbcCD ATPase subunit
MDRITINAAQAASESIGEQLQRQHAQEMDGPIVDNTSEIAETTQSGNAAMSETIRILTQERDAAKAECDAKAQRIEALLQALESIATDLKQKKNQLVDAERKWEEEKSMLERRCKTLKDKLALTTAAMEKRLIQAEQREEAERAEKKELWSLNEDLVASNRQVEEEALKAKASHEEWCRKYSAVLEEKNDVIRQYAVSLACSRNYPQRS